MDVTHSKFCFLGIQLYSNSNAKQKRFAKKLQLPSSGSTQCETFNLFAGPPPLSCAQTFAHYQMLIRRHMRECRGACMCLLDIRSKHAVIFLENQMDGSFAFFRETKMEKWGSNLGSQAWAVWHGAGERTLKPRSDYVVGSW
jgi:hypothetical protein